MIGTEISPGSWHLRAGSVGPSAQVRSRPITSHAGHKRAQLPPPRAVVQAHGCVFGIVARVEQTPSLHTVQQAIM